MKIAMIINKELPAGLLANTAAVLGVTLGHRIEQLVGNDVEDADGNNHIGITTKTIPVLGGTKEQLTEIRQRLYSNEFSDVLVVDFSEVAQRSLDYDNYTALMAQCTAEDLRYLGLSLYGPVKKVNKLTGFIGLLR